MVKRLSLPARVPFGVSEGNFAIGAAKIVTQGQMVSRSRLMDGRREREGEDAGTADRTREKTSETAGPVGRTDRSTDSSSGTVKIMSASPVGNFYVYSFDGKLLQLYNVYGILLKDYIYMGDRLIAEYDHAGARLLYYTPDQINTTRVITDQSGNVVYSAVHDPFGGIQQTPQNNTYDPQLKFSGKERDAESGLDYFGARYYDGSQYRFISIDPIISRQIVWFDSQLWNLYPICFNNPISIIDRTGEYGSPVHRQMTIGAGLKAGMPLKLTMIIVEANVAVDTNSPTSSGNPYHIATGVMMKWHFPTEARYHQMLRLARTTLDPVIFGQSLHVLQDAFGHNGYTDWGHGVDSVLHWAGIKEYDPDDPARDPGQAESATLLSDWLTKMFWERFQQALERIVINSGLMLFGGI